MTVARILLLASALAVAGVVPLSVPLAAEELAPKSALAPQGVAAPPVAFAPDKAARAARSKAARNPRQTQGDEKGEQASGGRRAGELEGWSGRSDSGKPRPNAAKAAGARGPSDDGGLPLPTTRQTTTEPGVGFDRSGNFSTGLKF